MHFLSISTIPKVLKRLIGIIRFITIFFGKSIFLCVVILACSIPVQAQKDHNHFAWGNPNFGQLGNGVSSPKLKPFQATTSSGWLHLSTGYKHGLGIKSDGTLWAWGYNYFGQVGDGVVNRRGAPVQIGSDTKWVMVAAGYSHSLGVKSDGTLWAWGNNEFNQLGDGTTIKKTTPVQVGSDADWVMVAAGKKHSLGVKKNGTLWAWGNNEFGQLGDGTLSSKTIPVQIGTASNWVSIKAGEVHSMGITGDGRLWAWGGNNNGQLGNGSIVGRSTPTMVGNDTNWSSIAAGEKHSLGIKTDGSLWAWGGNINGQLGDGTTVQRLSPVRIGNNTDWLTITAGNLHSQGIRTNGNLWAWGFNLSGQLGDGTTIQKNVPVQVGTDNDWQIISAGNNFSIAIKNNTTLWSWGNNQEGNLADRVTSPIQIGTDANWMTLASGEKFNLGIKQDGTLWAWGENKAGQLGDDTYTLRNEPQQVGTDADWASVAAGHLHSLGIKQDGALWSWGSNTDGQLGDELGNWRTVPEKVNSSKTWKMVAAGWKHSIGIKSDGTLWAWGSNQYGQVGDGTTNSSRIPVQIGTGSDWLMVSAGENHSLALKTDGTIWIWGYDNYGQMGASSSNNYSPKQLGTDTDWANIVAGRYHSHGLKKNGTLWSWGQNGFYQFGNGNGIWSQNPIQIGLDTDWVLVSAGFHHGLGIKSDGSLWAWGFNYDGQLGDGSDYDKKIPIQIGEEYNWTFVTAGAAHSVGLASVITQRTALASLTISHTDLSPAFTSRNTSYTATVDNSISSVNVVPVLVDEQASVFINGVEGASGVGSQPIALGVGMNSIEVMVISQDASISKTYSIMLTRENAPPILDDIHNENVNEGELLSFTASATDPDAGQTLSFTLINAPDGASINTATGLFSWTPTESQGPGTFTFSIKVTDNGSPALSDEKQITVRVAEVNLAPVLATIENVSTTCGNSISFTATATDSDLPANTLTYTLQGYIPAGANLNATSGAFSWTPSPEQLGTHDITLRVTDNGEPQLYHERIFTLVLEDKVPPMALVRNLTVLLNETGTATITADQLDGGSTDNCGIASMSIDKTTFSCANIGANEVILTVRDATGNTSTAVATVTVEISVGAPTASDTWPSSMVYNSTESFSINAVEGASGYTWTVPQGFEIVSGENTTNIHVRALSGSANGTISVRAVGACDEGAALVAAIAATKASATVAISDLNQEFSGEARAVTVSTDPLGLAVQVLYDGSTNVPRAEGEYSVSAAIIDDNYAGEANATLIISPVTSIHDTEVAKGLKLYPNPITGKARLEIEKGGTAQIVVTEISGRIIHRATVQGSYELNLESQPAGMYYMKVQLRGKPAVTLKLIKQ